MYAGPVGPVELVARSILFQTHVDKDLIFSETAGRNVTEAEVRTALSGNLCRCTGYQGMVRAALEVLNNSA